MHDPPIATLNRKASDRKKLYDQWPIQLAQFKFRWRVVKMLRRLAANKNALGERRGTLSCSWIYGFTIMRDWQAVP
jgi:hypothetical protein